MNDYELWEKYLELLKEAKRLEDEINRRGLIQKPVSEWSMEAQ